ncbi:MAG: CPBP family intramembrane metalloprotease [Candidatus Korarchaeota archaeon]|nr:CPBP family intramembrane metalloprotease [Candidatus Korarchaeota archaeon]
MVPRVTLGEDGRVLAVLETAIFEIAFFLIAWYLSAHYNYGNWLSKTGMILLALLGIAIHRSPERYGLSLRNPRMDLKWSLYVLLIVFGLGGIIAYLCVLLGLGAPGRMSPTALVGDALWYLVMVGFAEELFFRGYVQTRLNEVFTRRYNSLLGFKCVWHQGTLVTAVLYFGLPHILTDINPFMGDFGVSAQTLLIAASACFLGLIFGVMREKTGNILLPTIIHFSVVYSTLSLFPAIAGGFAAVIAPMIALFVFFLKPFQDFLNEKF